MNIKLNKFNGIMPRVSSRLLPETSAQIAENVDLLAGNIELLKTSEHAFTLPDSNQKTIYYYEPPLPNPKTWISWAYDVDVVKHPSADDTYRRIYWTGDPSGKLKMLYGVDDTSVTSSDIPDGESPTVTITELFDYTKTQLICSLGATPIATLEPISAIKSGNNITYSWKFPATITSGLGTALSKSISIPNAGIIEPEMPDTYTQCLLHFDGNFNDSSSYLNNPATTGDVAISSLITKFGTGSAEFPIGTTTARIEMHVTKEFGYSDFTVDTWVRFSDLSSSQYALWSTIALQGYDQRVVGTLDTLTIEFQNALISGGYAFRGTVSWTPVINTWYHIALVRKNGVIKFYINGISQTITILNGSGENYIPNASGDVEIGEAYGGIHINGNFDEFRWSFGIARWTSNFTPPTTPYTATISGVDLESDDIIVAHFDSAGVSSSPAYTTSTAYGRADVQCEDDLIPEMENAGFTITILRNNVIESYVIRPPYLEAGHGLQSYFNGIVIALNSTIPGGGFGGVCIHYDDKFYLTYSGSGIISFSDPPDGYSLYSGAYMHLNAAVFSLGNTYTVWNETILSATVTATYNFPAKELHYAMAYLNSGGDRGAASFSTQYIERTETSRVVLTLPVSSDSLVANKRLYRRYMDDDEFAFYKMLDVSNATTTYVDWMLDSALDRTEWVGQVDERDAEIPYPSSSITISTSDLYSPTTSNTSLQWSGSGLATRTFTPDKIEKGEDSYSATFEFSGGVDLLPSTTETIPTPTLTATIPGIGSVTKSNIGTFYPQTSDSVKWADLQYMGTVGNPDYTYQTVYQSLESGNITGLVASFAAISDAQFKINVLRMSGAWDTVNIGSINFTGVTTYDQIASAIQTALESALPTGSGQAWSVTYSATTTRFTFALTTTGTRVYAGVGFLQDGASGTSIAGTDYLNSKQGYASLTGDSLLAVIWNAVTFSTTWLMNYEFSEEQVYYLLTYVDDLGEESPISPLSVLVSKTPETRVVLTLPVSSSSTIVKKRIYRSVTGAGTAGFQFVVELDNATTSYVDWIKTSALAENLIVRENAPDNLVGICTMPNGFAAAFKGREIWFSDEFVLYSWKEQNVLSVPYDIIAIQPSGNDLVVMTKGLPYLVSGDSPENMRQSEIAFPQSCVSKRAVASLRNMVLYPSPDGLVAINGGQANLVTEKLFRRVDWQALIPASSLAEVFDNRYHFHCPTGSYIFDFDEIENGMQITTNTAGTAQAMYTDDEDDTMYYVIGDEILSWATSSEVMTGRWKSKVFMFDRPQVFTSCQVSARSYNGIAIKIWAGSTVIVDRNVYDNLSFRIPAGRPEREWQLQITTEDTIDDIQLSSSMITMQ